MSRNELISSNRSISAHALQTRASGGAVFTITGKLHMAPGKMITVDTAAKLVLDGGTITGIRDQMWKGIEVWGNSSKSQAPASNQGWFKAMNNAVIENATTGVATIKTARSYDYTCTGGIVQANKTTFRNCSQSIMFYPYENRNLFGSIYGNVSGFGNCTFEINNNYTGADTIKNIVSLDQVRGIDFAGCRFVNNCTSTLAGKPTGIFSFNSSFLIYSLLNCSVYPCFDTIHSEFNKLGYGIRALGSATTKTFKVDDAIFTANKYNGIYASSVDYLTLTKNKFLISATDTASASKPFGGAYLDTCTFYIIEENAFIKGGTGSPIPKIIGLTINNSGPYNNQIYKNTFNDLDIGILAQGKNKNPDNNNGLCLRCNTFNACKYDIAVTKPSAGSLTDNGIAKSQGSQSYPAGNLFTNTNSLTYPTYCNYFNIQDNSLPSNYIITYYHHDQTQQYRIIPNIRKNVNLPSPYTPPPYTDTTCASHLGGGIIPIDKLALNDAHSNLLLTLVDGGETEATASEVVYASPSVALELRDNLLQKSPYLSDTVMKEAIENETVLNNALLRDVLVANPQSAKSENLMQAVDGRSDPMPDYMKEEIEDGANIVSAREQLENNLSMARSEADLWYNLIVADILHDTAGVDTHALLSHLESRPRPANSYFIALQLLEMADSIQAFQLLADIPAQFGYEQKQLEAHNLLVQEILPLYPALFSGKPVTATDSSTVVGLQQQYNASANCWARNTLTAIGNLDFAEEYILPDATKSVEVLEPKQKRTISQPYLKVFPNPAHDFIVIEYLTGNFENSSVIISDANGRLIDRLIIRREANQIVYLTNNMVTGLYNCILSIGGKCIASQKFTVVR